MSDLSAAAAAMGLPETLVQRSAEARSAETGASVEEILAQWAGGEAAPAPAAEPEPAAEPTEEATTEETPAEEPSEPAAPEVVVETPGEPEAAPPSAVPAGPHKTPVLVGVKDNPMSVLAGVLGLFLIVVMVGLVGPSIATDTPGARTSAIDYSEEALHGQEIFAIAGCAACHTQMVRPVVADVGLGPVTLNDTNQVLGTRRFGPDLSDVGTRLTASQIEAIVNGLGDHPIHDLTPQDLTALIAYLGESSTGTGGS